MRSCSGLGSACTKGASLDTHGTSTIARPRSTPVTVASPTSAGVRTRVSFSGGTPSNKPVSTTLGQTTVTPTCRCPCWASSERSDSLNPIAPHLLAP